MLTQMLFSILFIVGMVFGAIYAYHLIVTSRKTSQRSDALYKWSDLPLPSWRYEPWGTAAMLIHSLSLLVLSFLALQAASNPGIINNPLFANDTTMIALVGFIQSGSIPIVGYHLGSSLIAFPLIVFRRKPVSVGITQKGAVFGQNLLPWHWFSHFSVDWKGGILKLYSAFAPDLPSLTLKVPDSIPLAELDSTMRGFLPLHPLKGNRAWYQTKLLLSPTMLLACLLVVVAGWLVSSLSQELALFAMALLATFLNFLGGLVLKVFGFGVLTSGNTTKKQPPAA